MVLSDVRGVGKDSPLAEIGTIVTFARPGRASPRTSLQISCCFMVLDSEIVLSVDTRVIQPIPPGDVGYTLRPLDSSCLEHQAHSSWCWMDPTVSSFLRLLCHHSSGELLAGLARAWGGQGLCSFRATLSDPGKGHTTSTVSPQILLV